jgi:uncharacterized membrane protein YkvA (DUF1232 family)
LIYFIKRRLITLIDVKKKNNVQFNKLPEKSTYNQDKMGIIMVKTDYNRVKQIEVNPEYADRRLEDTRNWNYLELLRSMLSDISSGRYPIPKKTALVGTFTLLYLISPIDIITDIIPVFGFADDIALLAYATKLFKNDLESYRAWKMTK